MTDAPGAPRPFLLRQAPRLYRLALLAAAAALLQYAAQTPRPPDDVPWEAAKTLFPGAVAWTAGDPRLGGRTVVDRDGRPLGLLVTTSPHADELIGYSGPSNLLIALDERREVSGVRLLSSGDTPAHVEQVRDDGRFWRQFVGSSPTKRLEKVDAVSGSTLTSMAMAEAVERRLRGASLSLRFPGPVTLDEVRALFPAAHRFVVDRPRGGWHQAIDERGTTLGYCVRTSPFSDNGRGYAGPTETLVAVDRELRTVVGLRLRKSYDTPEYVERVAEDEAYLRSLTGRRWDEWKTLDFAAAGIEGVSGATQTSFAVADGVRRRFAGDHESATSAGGSSGFSIGGVSGLQPGLLAVIVGALALTFTPLRADRRLRTAWQGVLIVAFAFWLGDLLSLALLAGWARHGAPWRTGSSAVLLTAVALLVPWAARKQIYCQQLCPHGAAQTWLGRFKRLHLHLRLPPHWQRWLERLPAALLAFGFLAAASSSGLELAWLEPFDGWVLKGAAAVSATVAIVGLVASLFVPQAYCRFGCPTGLLLRMVKSGGGHDRIAARDLAAGALVLLTAVGLGVARSDRFRNSASTPTPPSGGALEEPRESGASTARLHGRAFGVEWTVELRGRHDVAALQRAADAELERIEATLSAARMESFTTQFNAGETTLETEQPAELIALVAQALEISRWTDGAFDVTVGPLFDAWKGRAALNRGVAESNDPSAELLERVGWRKLAVDREAGTLRKLHPGLRVDFGSLLEGYAADRLGATLGSLGATEHLIDVGGKRLARGDWTVTIDAADGTPSSRRLRLKDEAYAARRVERVATAAGAVASQHWFAAPVIRPTTVTASHCGVIAGTALEADAWSTALLAIGPSAALELAESRRLAATMIDPQGRIHVNASGAARFSAP